MNLVTPQVEIKLELLLNILASHTRFLDVYVGLNQHI
jgi:hypothetical protein